MNKAAQALLLALFVTVCICNAHINVKYRDFLNGKTQFDLSTAKKIYAEFRSESFETSSYRFGIFVETLKQIREHNSGDHTWTKGVNQYSDMTEE